MNMELMSLLGQVGELSRAERAEHIEHYINVLFASKRALPQADYIDLLEKNVPYVMACCLSIQAALVERIHAGSPQFQTEKAYFVWVENLKSMARSDVVPVINYLAGRGESSDNNLTRYFTNVQSMKVSGQMAKYLDEMEFQMKFYQSIFEITQMFAFIITGNDNEKVASSFRKQSNRQELPEQLWQRIKIDANLCIDNITFA